MIDSKDEMIRADEASTVDTPGNDKIKRDVTPRQRNGSGFHSLLVATTADLGEVPRVAAGWQIKRNGEN